MKVVVTHPAWTESIYVWFPHVLERDGSAGGCRAAELATPGTSPDIAENITIAAHILVLLRRVVDDRVDPASDKVPAGTAGLRGVAIAGTFPHGYFEVPCYDETVAPARVENTFWGRATDELGCSVERKGGDTEAMAGSGILAGMKGMARIMVRVGD